jgi:hypothetical protein
MKVQLHSFLTSALDKGERSTACPGCFTPGKNAGIYWIGKCVDPKGGLKVLEKRKIACRFRVWNPGPPVPHSSRYTYALPGHFQEDNLPFFICKNACSKYEQAFISLNLPDGLWGTISGYRELFLRVKAARAWPWHTSAWWTQRQLALYCWLCTKQY